VPAARLSAMICFRHSMPESVKAGTPICTDPVDAETAILGEHVHLEFPQPFLILAERRRS
jgi:hypothetical protein